MNFVEEYNIEFINKIINGMVRKTFTCDLEISSQLLHVSMWHDSDEIEELIAMFISVINNNEMPAQNDMSNEMARAELQLDGIHVQSDTTFEDIVVWPVQRYYSLLLAWQDFINSEPLAGTPA